MGYIYMIHNKVNGKMYIGQTDNLEDRWRSHTKPTSKCTYLKNALKKYGLKNFEFKLLIICFNEDMDTYEIEYVRKYNTLVPNGYNLREGGSNGKHHATTKNKISTTLKSKTWDYAKAQL
jgi:group I intron endonuclease